MRFSDRITFVTEGDSYYDPVIGDYVVGETSNVIKPAKVSTMGLNRKAELFGSINEYVTIARLQNPYNESFTWVELDDNKFKVMQESNYKKGVLFLQRDSFG